MLSILVITYKPVCMRYFCVMQALRRQFEWDLNLATVQWFQLKKLLFLCNVVCKSCSRGFQFRAIECLFSWFLFFFSFSVLICLLTISAYTVFFISFIYFFSVFSVWMRSHVNKLMQCWMIWTYGDMLVFFNLSSFQLMLGQPIQINWNKKSSSSVDLGGSKL